MENERGKQEVLMALQGVGRLGIMMDPVFKLTAAGTILLIQHFARMYKEGLLNRRELPDHKYSGWKLEGIRKDGICPSDGRAGSAVCGTARSESDRWAGSGGNLWRGSTKISGLV